MRAPSPTVSQAKALRGALSLPEVILWDCLRAGGLEGLRFRRQHPVGPYVLDFYCASEKLAVEVDGAHHDLSDQMMHDARRDLWLEGKGIRVIRFAASDVLDDRAIENVLKTIAFVAHGMETPSVYRTRTVEMHDAPSGPSGHLPRKQGRIGVADGRYVGSSPAKRGRGTAVGGGGGAINNAGTMEIDR